MRVRRLWPLLVLLLLTVLVGQIEAVPPYRMALPLLPSSPPATDIAVVFVSLNDTPWSKNDRRVAVEAVNAALALWERGPRPHGAFAFDGETYRMQSSYNELWDRARSYRTVYIVETRQGQPLLWGHAYGYGQYGDFAVISARPDQAMGPGGPSEGSWKRWLSAVVGHEGGHMLYGLPDVFTWCWNDDPDIMGYADRAWDDQVLGSCSTQWLEVNR